ncbi:MAG: TadE/TadG family type IV pilus assembly protein [Phycisphaeraceae bacterium]
MRILRPLLRLHRDESAVATVEFALVFPVLLAFALILAQTSMLMAGNLYVHYAANAAARAASLQVPRQLVSVGGEPSNFIVHSTEWPKHEAITHAAIVAVVPAAGRLDAPATRYDTVPDALAEYFARSDRDEPAWIESSVAEKFRYAAEHTRVELARVLGDGEMDPVREGATERFGPREPIGVRVHHRLHLGVPYASFFFSDGTHTTANGETAYAEVIGRAVAINRGVNDMLPQEPRIPRRP